MKKWTAPSTFKLLLLATGLAAYAMVSLAGNQGVWRGSNQIPDCERATICVDWHRFGESLPELSCCVPEDELAWHDISSCISGTIEYYQGTGPRPI